MYVTMVPKPDTNPTLDSVKKLSGEMEEREASRRERSTSAVKSKLCFEVGSPSFNCLITRWSSSASLLDSRALRGMILVDIQGEPHKELHQQALTEC